MIDNELSHFPNALVDQFELIRQDSLDLCCGLSEADMQAQSMPDASPIKWHLAHTTWAFENFLLKPYLKDYQPFCSDYDYLFNSYYNAIGKQYPRPMRGLLTRPTFDEIIRYRRHVDNAMCAWLIDINKAQLEAQQASKHYLIQLCFNHEQQHQELMLTDLKHLFSFNPQHPALASNHPFKDHLEPVSTGLHSDANLPANSNQAAREKQRIESAISFPEGLYSIGHSTTNDQADKRFYFDNETPSHPYYLTGFKLESQLVSNAEYLAFIQDGGYSRAELWLSEAWHLIQTQMIDMPLYWKKINHQYFQHTLHGLHQLELDQPVSHVSYFEANAFANWKKMRLPTEQEWEVAATTSPQHFNGLFNQLWQWTSSSYCAYPGFQPTQGVVSEYNGKFMLNQYVLRGGSIATPAHHIRATYRNFFAPSAQWQFSGIRLAECL
ncbi:ergothioneine biosynthesis protein EgtB [Aliikangiella sp. IMCC44632]